MNQKLLAASIVALALAIVYASTPTATAQESSPGAACDSFVRNGKTAEWMNQQLADGRRNFSIGGRGESMTVVCAW
ncbi:MAG: hypothetical protein KTR31_38575 [Myxococcales bacterium]|nr:hypothetical protein [Myxococcales bacterium]